ncbi:MAG: DUF4410 domain-containing protein [Thermoanaerobaculia bacterium]
MRPTLRFVSLALAALLLPGAALAGKGKKAPPTTPGTYTDWNDEIDQLEVVEGFSLADYAKIAVEPFDTSTTPLPDKDDNTYVAVQTTLSAVALPLIEGLNEALGGKPPAEQAEGKAGAGALVVRGKIVTMDPGSRAARYWAGFGAGAARSGVDGEVVDGGSGKVLLRFRQERRSGVGVAGGDYVKLMQRNLRKIGEDLGMVLKAF